MTANRRFARFAAPVSLLVALLTTAASAASPQIPTVTKGAAAPHAADRVLIKFDGTARASSASTALRGVSRFRTLQSNTTPGARASRAAGWVVADLQPGMSVEAAMAEFGQAPGVAAVERDYFLRASDAVASATGPDPQAASQWALAKIQLPDAWAVHSGDANLVVAVIDSGVQLDHPDLASTIWTNSAETENGVDDDGNGLVDDVHGYNFNGNNANVSDDFGHGTHVAGIVAAIRNNGVGVAGTANVRIMPLKVLDHTGGGASDSMVVNAVNYAVAHGAKVINLSIGGSAFNQAEQDAIADAINAGVVVVAAAGNDGINAVEFPANYSGVLAVSATDQNDQLASFSNFGDSIALAAPGSQILSTVPGSTYENMNGTSMATPYVSGVVALVRSANPAMSAQAAIDRVTGTADDRGAPGRDPQFGFGRVNAYRALTAQTNPDPNPNPTPEPATDDSYEDNDVADAAKAIAPGTYQLSCRDDDWFRVHVAGNARLTATIQGASGDLDLFVFNAAGDMAGQSNGDTSNESVELDVTAGDWLIAVSPYHAQYADYTLAIGVAATDSNPNPNPGNQPPVSSGVCGAGLGLPFFALAAGLVSCRSLGRSRSKRRSRTSRVTAR